MIGLLALLLCQIAGDLIARTLGLAVPGPIIGIPLLFLACLCCGRIPEDLARTGELLLSWLPFLILPAGAGIMLYLGELAGEAVAILIALLLSTVVALGCTALTAQWLIRRRLRRARTGQRPDDALAGPGERYRPES